MIVQPDLPVILASASPRRKELLEKLGLTFKTVPAHIDESMYPNEKPLDHVRRLAEEKGRAIAEKYPEQIVISADTIVVYHGKILGKPDNKADAFKMLRLLSGNTHEVMTAFSILCSSKKILVSEDELTEVRFRDLSDDEILEYIEGGSPLDKAGAYGIQDVEAYLVDSINGSYHNVIGFPVTHFAMVWNNIINQ
ncbi:MAG: septum formation inhibitor Maf [Candidatus Neomarinimicrobiota bacterium]|nr:MAG: septum formation inhibitor Maf [Candidatus Neomarinimicrobiota bacterium]